MTLSMISTMKTDGTVITLSHLNQLGGLQLFAANSGEYGPDRWSLI
jgi:hypothetical protein